MVVEWPSGGKTENYAGTTAACYTGQSVSPPNYSRPLKPKLSTWYQPTGFSRWGYGLFLCSYVQLQQIQNQFSQNQPNPGANLVLTYYANGTTYKRTFAAFMLPAHPISVQASTNESFWIIPLVDDRYFWQFQTAFPFELLGPSLSDFSWTNRLLTYLNGATVPAVYQSVNAFVLSGATSYTNSAVLNDLMAHSVGMRLIGNYSGDARVGWRLVNYTNSLDLLSVNLGQATSTQYNAGLQQAPLGGAVSSIAGYAGIVPESVTVYFRGWTNGITYPDWVGPNFAAVAGSRYQKVKTAASMGLTTYTPGYTKSFISTMLADYTSGGINPDNQTALDALATQIATDFYGLTSWVQDSNFVGIGSWKETAFDDYLEFDAGSWDANSNEYRAKTRVHSAPYNFTCETLLHATYAMASDGNQLIWEHGDRIIGTLDGDLAAAGDQTITITDSDSPLPSGTTKINVSSFGGVTGAMGDPILGLRINNALSFGDDKPRWAAIPLAPSGGSSNSLIVGVAQDTKLGYNQQTGMAPVAAQSCNFTVGATTIASLVRYGLVIKGGTYLLAQTGSSTYEVVNPSVNARCTIVPETQTSSVLYSSSSIQVNVATSTVGNEAHTTDAGAPIQLYAYLRKGWVYSNTPGVNLAVYSIRYQDVDGWEIENPELSTTGYVTAVALVQTTPVNVTLKISASGGGTVLISVTAKLLKGLMVANRLYIVQFDPLLQSFYIVDPDIVVHGTLAAGAVASGATAGPFTVAGGGSITTVTNTTSAAITSAGGGGTMVAAWDDTLVGWALIG